MVGEEVGSGDPGGPHQASRLYRSGPDEPLQPEGTDVLEVLVPV